MNADGGLGSTQPGQRECSSYTVVQCRNIFVLLAWLSAPFSCLTFCSFIHRNLRETVYLSQSCGLKLKLRSPWVRNWKRRKLGIFLSPILAMKLFMGSGKQHFSVTKRKQSSHAEHIPLQTILSKICLG